MDFGFSLFTFNINLVCASFTLFLNDTSRIGIHVYNLSKLAGY